VLVWRFDRGSRDMTDALLLRKEVARNNGWLESSTQGKIDNTPMGEMLLALYSFAAATELDAMVARTRGGLRSRAESGKLLVAAYPLFGYTYTPDKSTYVIDEETAETVRRVYALVLEGKGTREIARILTAEGCETPSQVLQRRGQRGKAKVGAQWVRKTILCLLQNPAYKGQHGSYRYKAERTSNGHRRLVLREEGDATVIAHSIPAIVSEQDWQAAQQALKLRMLGPGRTAEQTATLLTRGFGQCGYCGRPLHSTAGHNGARYYQCGRTTLERDEVTGCPTAWGAKATPIDEAVWAKVAETGADIEHVKRVLAAKRARQQDTIDALAQHQQDTVDELANTERKMGNLVRRISCEDDDAIAAGYRMELQRLTAYKADLVKRRDGASAEYNRAMHQLSRFIEAHRLLVSLADNPDPEFHALLTQGLTREQKRNVMASLGVKVRIYRKDDPYTLEQGRRWKIVYGDEGHGASEAENDQLWSAQ
jgi:DNA invertase Pin-like site-specific DNA recombinase